MDLLYISTYLFHKENGHTYGLPSCSNSFFEKYLDVFDNVRVLGEEVKGYLELKALVEIDDPRIVVEILPANTSPKDFKNDNVVRRLLEDEISRADAIIIKPASRRGMKAIEIAKKYNRPYMIEMTGDIHNALKQHPNILKRMYSPYLYWNIKKHIADCKFGLYVSKSYLQSQFPIAGEMCGCSDVVLKDFNSNILENRLEKIEQKNYQAGIVNLCLVGFYQGKMKGVDCAIRALGKLPNNYHLNILGNGTERNQNKWFEYGKKYGVDKERIHFPSPLPSSQAVCEWFDMMDFFVFPTHSEGFGRVVVEAMSRGLVCFATDICTMPELLRKDCLFELDDDEKLSGLIIGFSNDKEKQKSEAKRNFEQAQEYFYDVLKERRNTFLHKFRDYCAEITFGHEYKEV